MNVAVLLREGDCASTDVFTEQLEHAIQDVVPSDDPFDAPDFNAVDFINQLFPNEQALQRVDQFMSKLQFRVKQLDAEILVHCRLRCW